MSAALNIPEGFVDTTQKGQLVFQNPANWVKAEAEGTMVVGTFEGLTDTDAYGKQNFKISATRDGVGFDKEGEEVSFSAGATVIINTSSNLASKMKEIEVGQEVAIIYNGQNKLSKGPYKGKMAHSYTVLQRG